MISKYNQIPENNGSIDTILDVYIGDSLCADTYLQAAFTPSITHTPSFSHFFKAHRSSVGVVGGRGWEVGVIGGRGWEETKCEISTGQKWETIYYKVVLSSTLRRNKKKKTDLPTLWNCTCTYIRGFMVTTMCLGEARILSLGKFVTVEY